MKKITIQLTLKDGMEKNTTLHQKSIFCLSNKNKVRKFLVGLITWKWFEIFITVMILANSAMLGMMDYTDPKRDHWGNNLVANTELFFIITFTIEATVKVLGMGFILGKGSYLRNAWNWLDFVVVIASLLTFLPQFSNISGLRTFRLFRPLRNLTTVPSMRTLVGTLLQSMSQLQGIMSLAIFFFLIFAILGVNLWSGKIHYRCWAVDTTIDDPFNLKQSNWLNGPMSESLCKQSSDCGQN